jgi:hypothetical protein
MSSETPVSGGESVASVPGRGSFFSFAIAVVAILRCWKENDRLKARLPKMGKERRKARLIYAD